MCQNITTTPDEEIIDEYHTSKSHICRGINETIRRIKDHDNWPGRY